MNKKGTKLLKLHSWSEIRKILNRCSEQDLKKLISELYSLSSPNKAFLEARFLHNTQTKEHYKSEIKRYLGPNEPWKASQKISLKDAKKVLSDYKKATSNKRDLIDLMIYYVECGTDFLCEFGDMYEQYYISLESVFENALKIMEELDKEEVEDFIQRLRVVVKKAEDMGWGYYDEISCMLNEAYEGSS